MANEYAWIWLIFLIIPLMRIIPRLLGKKRMQEATQTNQETWGNGPEEIAEFESRTIPKPQTKDMLVLGELNRGTNKFENIQKNTGLDSEDLNRILEDLEKRGLMKVEHKTGLMGPKIELIPTEKGFKEFYSQES